MVLDSEFPEMLEYCLAESISIPEMRDHVREVIIRQIEDIQLRMARAGCFPTKHQCLVYILMQASEAENSELRNHFTDRSLA